VDVLEELLLSQLLFGVAGEALEGGVHKRELTVHVEGDDGLSHCGRDGLQLALCLSGFAFSLPALPPFAPKKRYQAGAQDGYAGQEESKTDWGE
jgi:hypothetical protein